ncbi:MULTISPECIES: LysR substrate-binding domain-containing protein [Comamonas]|uniref:LysR substrate-binding domain-containing protein n=1 Tax=Comamonas thiooxydans TaxID=363952 RepID=A0A5M3M588_9BURK|nr:MULTISPECIES: LysR substrate-binding domain-containing protein [Comamonas]BCX52581.1 LysR family transcriptional regulator [Comamonas testosteroni]EFI62883.1 transcriptional regulator, LysR family protein [Comamonas thiooxydans]KKI15070.1 LysR family transcriptional regulator [Comamonas thiooxydans]MDH1335205.1 LysR substrate-binding domain-containing protein [Comamonas thiooxydans]MDH1740683.1 LysR substrate-binding domain-containing protein [Comamonas thiooxydans]
MLKELNTFIAVAREGTFAAAGDRIGLTQAAVSAQMQRLESELGFALFDRIGRTARLNKMGQQVLLQAQELLRLYANLGSSAQGQPASISVQLGSIASLQRSLLPDALARLHQQFPQCRTRIIPGVSLQLMNLVDAGELDMAALIRPPFALQSDLRWTALAHEPFRLLVPRATRGDDWAELLASQPFIRYDRTSFGGRQVDRFLRGMHFTLKEVCEADELEAIVKLVANGVGVALAPQTTAQRRWPAAVRAIDLGAHTFHRDVGLVHRAERHLSEPARVLITLLTKLARCALPQEH